MQNKIYSIFIVLILCLLSTSQAKEEKYNNTQPYYYWEKGNNGESLTINEFNIFMNEIETHLLSFTVKFNQIRLSDLNMTYNRGKIWEAIYNNTKESLVDAIDTIRQIKKHPNIITFSLHFYIVLGDIITDSHDFCGYEIVEKQIGSSLGELMTWKRAFQKAHLSMLAIAKDNKLELYK